MTTSVSIPDSRRANRPPWYRSLFLQLIVADAVAAKTGSGELPHTVEFLLNIIPVSIVSAFAENALLQVLFFAVLFGLALAKAGESGPPIVFELVDRLSHLFFTIIGWIMRFAPLGALGAMAYIVGQYGIASLGSYAKLIAACYIGATLFILILAAIVRYFAGVNLWKFVKYIKDELFLALGTRCPSAGRRPHHGLDASISESARKLRRNICRRELGGTTRHGAYAQSPQR